MIQKSKWSLWHLVQNWKFDPMALINFWLKSILKTLDCTFHEISSEIWILGHWPLICAVFSFAVRWSLSVFKKNETRIFLGHRWPQALIIYQTQGRSLTIPYIFVSALFLLGCAHAILTNKSGHLSVHGALGGPPWFVKATSWFMVEFCGQFSLKVGEDIHIKYHHPYTNIIGLGDSRQVLGILKCIFKNIYLYFIIY